MDPDQAFYLNANPDLDLGSKTNADPGPGQIVKEQNLNFYMKNIHTYIRS